MLTRLKQKDGGRCLQITLKSFYVSSRPTPQRKKMAMSTMPSVVGNGITGKYAAHVGRQSAWPASQKDMCVIVHEDPGVNGGLRLNGDIPQSSKKVIHLRNWENTKFLCTGQAFIGGD